MEKFFQMAEYCGLMHDHDESEYVNDDGNYLESHFHDAAIEKTPTQFVRFK